MKILNIGSYYPTIGGAERHLYELCLLLSKNDDPIILAPLIKGKCPKNPCKVIRAFSLIDKTSLVKRFSFLEYIQNYSFILPAILKGIKIIKEKNIDLIHVEFGLAFGIVGCLLKKFTKKPLILTLQGSGLDFKGVRKLFKPLSQIVLKNTNVIIAVSNAIKGEARKITKKKIEVIPNSVFISNFRNAGDKNFILSVGRLAKMKGFEYLIKACSDKRLQNIEFLIVGEGPERKNLENEIKKLRLTNIKLLGALSHEKVRILMSECSIFVVPSIYGEGLPIALIEAMACNKPVIGTKVRGIPEAIKNEKNGFLVKPANAKEISNAVFKLIKNKKLRKQMGIISRQIVIKKFSWKTNITKIKEIYSSLFLK